jgi:plasmid stabilization system protein ParE
MKRNARDLLAAVALAKQVEQAVAVAAEHPHLYRHGRIPGTRELVAHPNYIVVYRAGARLEVLSVLHSRQQYPAA